jgi:hypothetical protein
MPGKCLGYPSERRGRYLGNMREILGKNEGNARGIRGGGTLFFYFGTFNNTITAPIRKKMFAAQAVSNGFTSPL